MRDAAPDRLPRTLYVETTNRCNLRCRGCIQYRGSWEAPRDLTLVEFEEIVDQASGAERFMLHGIGEPLLNPQLPAMIQRVKTGGASAAINSNGTLLDRRMAEALIEAGLDELRLSLDAATPEGYAAVRGGDFEALLGRIRAFVMQMLRGG